PPVLSNIADATRRMPYFGPGCPHNTSTRLPAGSSAHSGIGCHVMATWMERSTEGLIQMGGEGVDWVAQSRFTATPHIFQNLGDGTYYHSGMLAIRQATAAGATMTYKILYNDAVAMTGGQPIDGPLSVAQVARQVEAEGVTRLAIVSDDIGKYRGGEDRFPPNTSFHDRHELDAVQRQLREIPGVTVLIYDQTCAAQKRRLRKRGALPDPARRLFIHPEICEGCGDCGRASNCIALLPLETPAGRKRRLDQWACNKDYSCLDAECPSFVSVIGAQPRRAIGTKVTPEKLAAEVAALPLPRIDFGDAPWDLLIAGVGGTGVVTLGALVAMAAHLDGHSASTLDFAGFAQKGGAVLTFVRLAAHPGRLNQARIDTQQADVLLACDLVVGASQEALQAVRHERTRILANLHQVPNDSFVRNPDATLHATGLLEKLRFAAGDRFIATFDAQLLAQHFIGDTMGANMVALGFAWQRGCVPVSLAALERSIELNDTEVAMNRAALGIGRLAAAAPEFVAAALAPAVAPVPTLEELVAAQCDRLGAYQGRGLAARYRERVEQVRSAELRVAGTAPRAAKSGAETARTTADDNCGAHDFPLTRAFATQYARLLALKDEYEVARLLSGETLRSALRAEFEGEPGSDYGLRFHFSLPPLPGMGGKRSTKLDVGQWALPLLSGAAWLRRVRGTWLDPLRFSARHRAQRRVAEDYAAAIIGRLAALTVEDLPEVT
ncbi:MAG: indolepyruvate ferredoxin oxidoreductase family protein, partial [Burkholderiaceae bacterium]|nr:indolepyruvate ferredoxin oxidoreductase family protein [Burkholderiaceae bacterium]